MTTRNTLKHALTVKLLTPDKADQNPCIRGRAVDVLSACSSVRGSLTPILAVCILLLGWMSLSAASAYPPNLLTNGNFESFEANGVATSWSTLIGSGTIRTFSEDTGLTGSAQKIEIIDSPSWGIVFYQVPGFVNGTSYEWRIRYKTSGSNTITAQIANSNFSQVLVNVILPATNGAWNEEILYFTHTNPDANQLRIHLGNVETAWLDGMALFEVDPYPPNLLTNGNFESFETSGVATSWSTLIGSGTIRTFSQDTGLTGSAQKIEITSSPSWGIVFYQVPGFVNGTSYEWRIRYKTGGSNTIKAEVANSNFSQVVVNVTLPATNGAWNEEILYFTHTNPDANQLRIQMGSVGSVWLDGMALFEVISDPPVITQHPQSQTVEHGDNAQFSVTATGDPAPSYQWRKGGNEISGATSDTLVINNAVFADAGSYDVVVSNSGGSVTSNAATLTVEDTTPPTVPQNLAASNVTDTTVDLNWSASSDNVGVEGYKVYTNGANPKTVSGTSTTMSGLAAETAYSFTVSAFDAAQNESAQSTPVNVTTEPPLEAPVITSHPQSQVVEYGGNAQFSVTATGNPEPQYQWRKSGNAISGATSATLVISSVTFGDAGSYDVVVTNSEGSVTSNAATLTVEDTTPPTVPQNLAASNVTDTTVDLNWSESSDNVGVEGYKVYTNGVNPKTVSGTSTTMSGLAPETAYSFTVSAFDAAQNESAQSTPLNVTTEAAGPEPYPANLLTNGNFDTFETSGVATSWSTLIGSGTIYTFSEDTGLTGSAQKIEITDSPSWGIVFYQVPGFVNGTSYEWRIRYKTSGSNTIKAEVANSNFSQVVVNVTLPATNGAWNEEILYFTHTNPDANQLRIQMGSVGSVWLDGMALFEDTGAQDTEPPTAPANLTATAISQNAIDLSWDPSTDNVGVAGYDIYRNGTYLNTTTQTSYPDSGLTSATQYSYVVYAFDAANNVSPPSNTAQATTLGQSVINHGAELTLNDVGLTDESVLTSSGPVSTSYHGQVIENLDIYTSSSSGISVNHNNVTIRNCRISHAGGQNGVSIASSVTGTLVEHCSFDGMDVVLGNYGTIGIRGGSYSVIRRNFFKRLRVAVTDIRNNTQVIENWAEQLKRDNGSHGNSFSYHGGGTGQGVQFLRNRAEASNSGGISFYARHRAIKNCESKDNLIHGIGLGFGLYGGYTGAGSGAFYHHDNEFIEVEGNRFTGTFAYPNVLGEGTNCAVNINQTGNTFTNNRWLGGSTDLPPRCGVKQDDCES